MAPSKMDFCLRGSAYMSSFGTSFVHYVPCFAFVEENLHLHVTADMGLFEAGGLSIANIVQYTIS